VIDPSFFLSSFSLSFFGVSATDFAGAAGAGAGGEIQNVGYLLWILLMTNATESARTDVRRTTGR